MTTISTPTKSHVVALVQDHLKKHSFGDITFQVDEQNIQNGDGWWRVPIRASYLPKRLFTLYEYLAEVEAEIREEQPLNILLMSGEPLTEETEDTHA